MSGADALPAYPLLDPASVRACAAGIGDARARLGVHQTGAALSSHRRPVVAHDAGARVLAWYARPGHAAPEGGHAAYRDWILEAARGFWESFRARFLALWRERTQSTAARTGTAGGDAFPAAMFRSPEDAAYIETEQNAFVDSLFADMLGFAACKMIRRIVGFAHVLDFESIADAAVRATCEAGALAMAKRLLTSPGELRSVSDVIDAVRGATRAGPR